MVKVPKQVMVAPLILGAVVCPAQFQVKLLNVCVCPAPNQPPAAGLVKPRIAHVDPEFHVAIGIPNPDRAAAAAMAALLSNVPPLLIVSVVVLAPVIGVVLATAERNAPLMEVVAPVMFKAFAPISNRALASTVSELAIVMAAAAVTVAVVLEINK